ncbi:MAG: Gfo/Idh/MocA family oxidoreductase [Deltaproteobacteria bacterium]|nr:Gfo/Idh/MocA family oxidoreductase [Deltaproteobacteria bacterium]
MIGVGYLGSLHAQKYAMLGEAELVGVVDADPRRASEIAEKCNTAAFGSCEELFGKVDAVSIATPTAGHFETGMKFLSRGVDCLIEKPIANAVDQASSLVREAAMNKAILQVGHIERFNAAVAALAERTKDVSYMRAQRITPYPNRSTDVDVVLDLMIHDIDIVLSIARSEVASVDAAGASLVSGKTDFASARLAFASGCKADITASRISHERLRKIILFQPGQYLTADCMNQRLSVTRPAPASGPQGAVEEEIPLEKRDALLEEIRAFLLASATRRPPFVTGEDALAALSVAEAIQRSIAENAVERGRRRGAAR